MQKIRGANASSKDRLLDTASVGVGFSEKSEKNGGGNKEEKRTMGVITGK